MKRDWLSEELREHFSLSVSERQWLRDRGEAHNLLGLAVELKCFQYLGYFVEDSQEIPALIWPFLYKPPKRLVSNLQRRIRWYGAGHDGLNDGCNTNQLWKTGELETAIEVDMLPRDGRDMSEQGGWVFVASFLMA